jgi:hypothetical protein
LIYENFEKEMLCLLWKDLVGIIKAYGADVPSASTGNSENESVRTGS